MTAIEHPRVTFALFSYNQQEYIEEAVAAALAQTYSPLEIVISDDCSTDQTFDLIEKRVRNYRGPHRIVLNRNASNLGIAGHVNKVIQQAAGELIVLAAGDDVSEANRTRELVQYWLAGNKTLDAIWSDVRFIDAQGGPVGTLCSPVSDEPLEAQVEKMVPALLGCSHATTKRLFLQYGPLREDLSYEDRAFAFRALCAGGVGRIEQFLVRYRVHAGNVSDGLRVSATKPDPERKLNYHRLHLQRQLTVFLGYQEDISKIDVKIHDAALLRRVDAAVSRSIAENAIERQIHSAKLIDRLSGFSRGFFRWGPSARCRARYVLTLISPRLWFYLSDTLIMNWVRNA